MVATDSILQRYEEALAQQDGVDLDAATRAGQFTVLRRQGTVEEAIGLWERLFAHAFDWRDEDQVGG